MFNSCNNNVIGIELTQTYRYEISQNMLLHLLQIDILRR